VKPQKSEEFRSPFFYSVPPLKWSWLLFMVPNYEKKFKESWILRQNEDTTSPLLDFRLLHIIIPDDHFGQFDAILVTIRGI
jgi:hypothetical protein